MPQAADLSPGSIGTSPVVRLLNHHLEAVAFQGIGWGSDAYAAEPLRHPMAVALYLRALSTLSAHSDDPRHARAREQALSALLEARSPRGSWGLGFSHWGLSDRTPYAITTALAGSALAEHFLVTGDQEVLGKLSVTADWLTRSLPWGFQMAGAGPWYAPDVPDVLPNVASTCAGFLHQAHQLTGDPRLRRAAAAATEFVLVSQRAQGDWGYGGATRRAGGVRSSDIVDSLHTGYVLDGLLTVYAGDHGTVLSTAIDRGLRFVQEQLVREDGFCFEKVLPIDGSDPANEVLLDNPRLEQRAVGEQDLLLRFPTESRLWGYGALLRAAARGEQLGFSRAGPLADCLLGRLVSEHMSETTGRFRYLADDPRAFPRHEAHAFEGVCAVIAGTVSRSR